MDQKVLLLLVVLALVGIAYYVRFKPHRAQGESSGTKTTETAAPGSKPPRSDACDHRCISAWTKCGSRCGVDASCSNRCDRTKESCLAACR